MNRHGGNWEVPPHAHLMDSLTLPDADDHHVLAAAIASEADYIVTLNLSDFPNRILSVHGTRAVHPDVFALELLDRSPDEFLEAVRRHRVSLHNPAKTAEMYLNDLEQAGLWQTAGRLRQSQNLI